MRVMIYAGNAGDRNDRGMPGAVALGEQIADALGTGAEVVGTPAPVIAGGWLTQLHAATPNLRLLSEAMAEGLRSGTAPILTMGRCAAGLATLPRIAQHYPDAVIVWFDAHGDSNVPVPGPSGDSAYLGGMVITGAAGEWETGLGAGLDLANVVLVGARDLDLPELARIAAGQIKLVPVSPDLPAQLSAHVEDRRVYIHLDCDVMAPGLLATEYQVTDGLSFADLHAAFTVLARQDVVGLEIAEFEASWPDGRPASAGDLIAAIRSVTQKLQASF